MSNLQQFPINLQLYKKRILIRAILIFTVNLALLGLTVWSAPSESRLNYLAITGIVITAIGLFLNKNYERQVSILKDNYLELNNHILQWYTGNGKCTTINLKRVKKIERDKYRSFDRFLIFEGENPEIILNLLEPDEFQNRIEEYTKLKTQIFIIPWRSYLIKGVSFFIPALIAFGFYKFQFLELKLFFLILNMNAIFFLVHFSEKRTRGGFAEATVRRSSIILFLLLAYQLLLLFG
ncbi:MAG TPA: hypothetical protein PK079_08665 [Leptospiraceae bacterium]|nr:hypothetical protein [Leptospiraceae bacterium]HMW04279.1 hypothetical protein [Leptospiraceae bacterium]HMX30625.1 hypothetical protein [Leptospiraceae bacterium]HMY31325.1 hypothetical protein [Leptospiraceae bacterium]HMZ63438.1 hypothetical protein [Leptospiraceae bacterium]